MHDTYRHYSRIVDYYKHYRPRYPHELIGWLHAECGLAPSQVVVDIGAGTGQMTELFLAHGNQVYAIEPNADMRRVAEEELRDYPSLTSIDATAEATTLPDQSVHLITVGNAFHWFNHDQVRREFRRILVSEGWVVLAWNLERHNGSPFADAFEQFWQTYIDPSANFFRSRERQRPEYITRFFDGGTLKEITLDNALVCNFDALKGLVLSILSAPHEGEPRYREMLDDLGKLFRAHEQHGTVTVDYDTAVVYGQLGE